MPQRRRYERTPDTLALLSACAVTAGALTLTGHVPRSVVDLAPYWVALVWSAAFSLAAAVALVGVLHRDPLVGWILELVGRGGLVLVCAGYVLALTVRATTWGTSLVVAVIAAIGISSAVRVWQIRARLRDLRATLRGAA